MDKHNRGLLKILQRYIDGKSRPEEEPLMDLWYESIDHEKVESEDELTLRGVDEKMWNNIQSRKVAAPGEPEAISIRWWNSGFFRAAAAAAVLFVLAYAYYMSDFRRFSDFPVKGVSRETLARLSGAKNTTGHPQVIKLADGSSVTLEPGASLYYPQTFEAKSRTVYLVGNGFFDIARNPAKPFVVFSENIVTKVLGTSFTIRKDDHSGNVEVAVVTGKVIVERAQGSKPDFTIGTEGVTLTPNEKVTFMSDSEEYVTGIVEKPVMVGQNDDFKRPDAFVFEEVTLGNVIGKLEKAYGVKIEIANTAIVNCPITADLSQNSLFSKLEVINALLNTKLSLAGTSIILSEGECLSFNSVHDNP